MADAPGLDGDQQQAGAVPCASRLRQHDEPRQLTGLGVDKTDNGAVAFGDDHAPARDERLMDGRRPPDHPAVDLLGRVMVFGARGSPVASHRRRRLRRPPELI